MQDYTQNTCRDFVTVLASKSPVPGGGGASALVGAVGMALGNMVGSLTIGKKKYADVQDDIIAMQEKANIIQDAFLKLVQEDALVFEPLSKAYGLPKETEEQKIEKARVMEIALKDACSVPLKIMKTCCDAIDLHADFAAKGTAIAISDVGVGVTCCRAALHGASLNVFINTSAMTDRVYADDINNQTNKMLEEYTKKADTIYADVLARLK